MFQIYKKQYEGIQWWFQIKFMHSEKATEFEKISYSNLKLLHSVLERIWIKGSYLSQWLPQGERGPPKES